MKIKGPGKKLKKKLKKLKKKLNPIKLAQKLHPANIAAKLGVPGAQHLAQLSPINSDAARLLSNLKA